MVAALKFFLGSDRENEKNSDDSDSDVIILYILCKVFSVCVKEPYNMLIHGIFWFKLRCLVNAIIHRNFFSLHLTKFFNYLQHCKKFA